MWCISISCKHNPIQMRWPVYMTPYLRATLSEAKKVNIIADETQMFIWKVLISFRPNRVTLAVESCCLRNRTCATLEETICSLPYLCNQSFNQSTTWGNLKIFPGKHAPRMPLILSIETSWNNPPPPHTHTHTHAHARLHPDKPHLFRKDRPSNINTYIKISFHSHAIMIINVPGGLKCW